MSESVTHSRLAYNVGERRVFGELQPSHLVGKVSGRWHPGGLSLARYVCMHLSVVYLLTLSLTQLLAHILAHSLACSHTHVHELVHKFALYLCL